MTINQRFGIVITGLTAIQGLTVPILYLMLLDKGISIAEIGILLAILTFFTFVFELPFGTLADNFGRKKIFLAGELFLLIVISGYFLADSFYLLALVMMLNGIGSALISGTLDALFVEKHTLEIQENRSELNLQQAQALFGTFQAIGLAIGGILAGFLPMWFKIFTDQTTFIRFYEINLLFLIPLVIIHFFLTIILIPESKTAKTTDSIKKSMAGVKPLIISSFKLLSKNKVLLILFILEFLGGMGAISIEQLWQLKFAEIIDARSTTWAFGILFTVNFLFVAIGQGISIPLGRLFGHNYNRMLIFLELILAILLFIFSFQETAYGFIIFYLALSLVAGASVSPFMTMIHKNVPEESRSSLLSVKSMFLQTGFMVGAVIAGNLANSHDIKTAWQIASLILFIAILLYFLPSIRKFGRDLAEKEKKQVTEE